MIGSGVHIFVDKKIFESYFSDRLTFSNIRSRTSRRIYRLALPLRAPETLSSLSKSRISVLKAHLTLFVRRMMSHNSIGKYCHLVNWLGTCLGTECRRWQTRQVESLQNWKEVNVGCSACLVNWLGTCYGIINQGPVSIIVKLYQFHIVTAIELCFVWLIVVTTARSYLLLSVLFTSHFQQRQTRLQDNSDRKAICSQLETLEMRAIIYNFIL